MVSNDKILPEPPGDMDENFGSNHEDIIMGTDSDSEEDDAHNGYVPLPVVSSNELYDSTESDDSGLDSGEQEQSNGNLPPVRRIDNTLEREVWSGASPAAVDITMDSNKVNEVKQVMVNVTLPPSSIPEWANNVPEEQWKMIIIKRIQELQQNLELGTSN